MADLLSVHEAQRLILERVRPLGAERVPIERAAGRVLAERAVAQVDLPPFPSSAMDGYAVRSADTAAAEVRLALVGRVAAGAPAKHALGPGEAMAIATGACVPAGADAVVPLELADEQGEVVVLSRPAAPGANVRARGSDVDAGAPLLSPGSWLGPVQVGALAAAGVSELRCTKRPRVGILVTGSELRRAGGKLQPGEIYESNGILLATALQLAGAVPAQLGLVADDEEELERTVERAVLGFDMLVTSGGASVGPHDLVRRVQERLRIEEVFWGVAVKPGKPVAFAMRREHPVFNLPGNPVSALVCFELFVRPAINAQLGLAEPLPALPTGRLAAPVSRHPHRTEFLRGRIGAGEGEPALEPLAAQESHQIASAAGADALIEVEPGESELSAGSRVRYVPLR